MKPNRKKNCDVLIIGAGMAGSCLARQLTLEQPDLKIIIVERREEFNWWIGESTVEVFDDYAFRNLKLGPYLISNHIVKHGLRFWFDSEEKDLPMRELSEQGRTRYSTLNRGVQLNRAKLDRDMVEINRAGGVEVLLGTSVLAKSESGEETIVIDREQGHHVLTDSGSIRCKYLVDAGGLQAPLIRKLELKLPHEPEFPRTGSYWARVSNCNIIDELGDEAWRARVDHTSRWASTNHFMYDGYWIWLIPLTENLVSLGVVFDQESKPLRFKDGDGFIKFIRKHRALDELLGQHASVEDFLGAAYLVNGVKQYYSSDRWFITGMGGCIVDPLFSPASAYFVTSNRFISSIIEADKSGDEKTTANRIRHFNIAMRNVFKRAVREFSHYHQLGSFDAFVNWQTLRYHTIMNYNIPMQHSDFRPFISRIDKHEDDCECAIGRWSEAQCLGEANDRLTLEFTAFLDENGGYYSRNHGYFHDKTERVDTREHTMSPDFEIRQHEESLLNYEAFFRYFIQRMCDIRGISFNEGVFKSEFAPEWSDGQSLEQVFTAMLAAAKDRAKAPMPAERWDLKGPVDLQLERQCEWRFRFLDPDGKPVHP